MTCRDWGNCCGVGGHIFGVIDHLERGAAVAAFITEAGLPLGLIIQSCGIEVLSDVLPLIIIARGVCGVVEALLVRLVRLWTRC